MDRSGRTVVVADAADEFTEAALAAKRLVDASRSVTHSVTDETLHYVVPVAEMRALRQRLFDLDTAVRRSTR